VWSDQWHLSICSLAPIPPKRDQHLPLQSVHQSIANHEFWRTPEGVTGTEWHQYCYFWPSFPTVHCKSNPLIGGYAYRSGASASHKQCNAHKRRRSPHVIPHDVSLPRTSSTTHKLRQKFDIHNPHEQLLCPGTARYPSPILIRAEPHRSFRARPSSR